MNWQLFSIIFTIASTVAAGVLITAALVTGLDQALHIVIAAVAGLLAAMPIAWIIAKKMQKITTTKPSVIQ